MEEWKNIKFNGIAKIDRLVDEFEVWEFNKIPHGKFKIKIFEAADGKFTGRTNLMVIDTTNSFCSGVGYGNTVGEALEDTIRYFYSLIEEVGNLTEESFKYVAIDDF